MYFKSGILRSAYGVVADAGSEGAAQNVAMKDHQVVGQSKSESTGHGYSAYAVKFKFRAVKNGLLDGIYYELRQANYSKDEAKSKATEIMGRVIRGNVKQQGGDLSDDEWVGQLTYGGLRKRILKKPIDTDNLSKILARTYHAVRQNELQAEQNVSTAGNLSHAEANIIGLDIDHAEAPKETTNQTSHAYSAPSVKSEKSKDTLIRPAEKPAIVETSVTSNDSE